MGQLSVTLNWEIGGEIREDDIPKDTQIKRESTWLSVAYSQARTAGTPIPTIFSISVKQTRFERE